MSKEVGIYESESEALPGILQCLKKELEKLVHQGELDAELIFVSKYFHVDYSQIEKNLRPVIEKALERFSWKSHSSLRGSLPRLGQRDEKTCDEYGIIKIDALNCIDCQMGGKGKSAEADPNHDLIFSLPWDDRFLQPCRTDDEERRDGQNCTQTAFQRTPGNHTS